MPPDAKWRCQKCGEDVSDNYAECWNCSTLRPDLPTYADQVAASVHQQTQMQQQLDLANAILKKQEEQGQVMDRLLARWDVITQNAEGLISKLNHIGEQK